ncbi:MAG: hypothetical protein JO121_08070 [Deltaproteobacteria bacterium]|nr:hypothetical protein [Deltaproteobacteria bacterium]
MTFLEFLNEQQLDAMTIQQATRYYIAEKQELPPTEMRKAIGAPEDKLDAAQQELEQDPQTLENACLATLSAGWQEDETIIRNAFAEAKTKLPVIEVAILAVVAMYGMYLAVTGGVKKKIVQRKPDGSYTETTEYYASQGPLGAIVNLVKGRGSGA